MLIMEDWAQIPEIDYTVVDTEPEGEAAMATSEAQPDEINYVVVEYPNVEELEQTDITYIVSLFKSMIKLQILHWAANKNSLHVHIDEFIDILKKFIDDFAENVQGFKGTQFNIHDFESDMTIKFIDVQPNENEDVCYIAQQELAQLKTATTSWWNGAASNASQSIEPLMYEGIKNVVASFIEAVNKYLYLLKIDSRE